MKSIILNSGFVSVHVHTLSKQRWRDCVFVVTQCCKLLYLQSDGLEFEVEAFFEVELAFCFRLPIFFDKPTLGNGTPKQIFGQIADKSHQN